MKPQPQIGDYAIIGNGRSAALVSKQGSIDWLCWPQFDSPSLFGALLDPDVGGYWSISPAGIRHIERTYLGPTAILQTRFITDSGIAVLTDLMPVASEEQKKRLLMPENELVRRLECEEGELEAELVFQPAPEYALGRFTFHDAGRLGLRLERGSRLLTLRGDIPLHIMDGRSARGKLRLQAGQAANFSLTYSLEMPAVLPPLGDFTRQTIARSVDWWQGWARKAKYEGPYREAVLRSALTLKLLSFAPSGAVIAAPTASLPERIGGDLNWDYRYCWLRDASLTTRALYGLGYEEEAEAFVSWLLHATRLTRPALNVAYTVYGDTHLRERTLPHFSGYRDSRPVRIGNAAAGQFQLDIYGETVDAASQLAHRRGDLDRETQEMLIEFGRYVCRHWQMPDQGIWEPRGAPQWHTHSLTLCWTALDRLIMMHERGSIRKIPQELFHSARDQIRRTTEQQAWNPRLNSYTQTLGGNTLDAAVILMAWYGFETADSPRLQSTRRALADNLGLGRGLIYRYEQSRSAGEGAFGICCFWLAEFLARGGGTLEVARSVFEDLLAFANDVGLYAEEIDPRTGEALGNFPQAFTHVGLINAALTLTEREQQERENSIRRLEPQVKPEVVS